MGWSIGYDSNWKRDIGYGVPATCDHPGCNKKIHRGLSYVCGGQPYGGDDGCGLYFCSDHLFYNTRGDKPQQCERCCYPEDPDDVRPFDAKPDHSSWIKFKLKDASWSEWRAENPDWVRQHSADTTKDRP